MSMELIKDRIPLILRIFPWSIGFRRNKIAKSFRSPPLRTHRIKSPLRTTNKLTKSNTSSHLRPRNWGTSPWIRIENLMLQVISDVTRLRPNKWPIRILVRFHTCLQASKDVIRMCFLRSTLLKQVVDAGGPSKEELDYCSTIKSALMERFKPSSVTCRPTALAKKKGSKPSSP